MLNRLISALFLAAVASMTCFLIYVVSAGLLWLSRTLPMGWFAFCTVVTVAAVVGFVNKIDFFTEDKQ